MRKINLQDFCANERDIRFYLQSPFEKDGTVYATNGHLLIAVPANEYPGAQPHVEGKHSALAAALVEKAFSGDDEFHLLPQLVEPPKCRECEGTGVADYDDGPEDCLACGGSGYERFTVVAVGDTTFAAHYIYKLRVLPGATIKPNGIKAPAAILFTGGRALLMPCKV